MKAIRLHPNPDQSNPYSATNPAPLSALSLDSDLPIPEPLNPGELLKSTEDYKILGWDFAGTIIQTASGESSFHPGDEVYGMTRATRAGAWSEYIIVSVDEACLKPKHLTWAQAAVVPMSGLTAYQALFVQANLTPPTFNDEREVRHLNSLQKEASILVTGATGGVGLYVVQLARLANLNVVAATRTTERNKELLEKLGADEIVEYSQLVQSSRRFDIIIDTVGGEVLKHCWSCVKQDGAIISVDSASFDFPQEHGKIGLNDGCENVKAKFFIVSPSDEHLKRLPAALDQQLLHSFVADVLPLADVKQAYNQSSSTSTARGKLVLVTSDV